MDNGANNSNVVGDIFGDEFPDTQSRPIVDDEEDVSSNHKPPIDHRLSVQRTPVFNVLQQLASDNAIFFQKYTASSPFSPRIVKCCREISRFAQLAGGI